VAVPGARLPIEIIGGNPRFGLATVPVVAATTVGGPVIGFIAPGVAAGTSLLHVSVMANTIRPASKQKIQFFLKVSISPSFMV